MQGASGSPVIRVQRAPALWQALFWGLRHIREEARDCHATPPPRLVRERDSGVKCVGGKIHRERRSWAQKMLW